MSKPPNISVWTEILFWVSLPFLAAFALAFGVVFLVHHFFWRKVLNKKGESYWEWFGHSEEDIMFGPYRDSKKEG